MFGSEVAFALLCSLFEEVSNELVDDGLSDHGPDWDWIVLQDVDQTLLDEGTVDCVWLLQEQFDPPWKIDLVLQEILNDLLHKHIGQFEYFSDFQTNGTVLSDIIVGKDLLERLIKGEDQLDDQLSNAGLH